MSDCKDKKCKDCNEDYLQGMLPCVTLPELCVDGETCEETYNANCVRYTGSAVVCGTTTVLSTGMTTQEALISLANAICLSGGGGLVDLTELEECCDTNTTNITTLQNNYTVINNTVNTITNQISTINTNLTVINGQITDLQACCDASVKFCGNYPEFPFSYGVIGCQTPAGDEAIAGQDFFYIDKFSAGLSHSTYGGITTGGFGGTRLQLPPPATASAFYIEASADLFGLSWNPTLPNSQYYKTIQAVLGVTGIPYSQTTLLAKGVVELVGIQGAGGMTTFNNHHIDFPNPTINPLLMIATGVQGIASLSNIKNIGGEFLSLWRNFQTAPNTAIGGEASGSNLNTGYDIEVGKTTDTNRTNIGGKIIVKSGAGGTNHGLKIDVSQALGVTYALQLKDTTAAAGKFLKAVDSDGNAIWDTVTTGGTVPPGVVSNNNINGTTNYVTKWTAADKIGDSIIQDNGSQIAINAAPDAGAQFRILSNIAIGIDVLQTVASNSNYSVAYNASVLVSTNATNTGFSAAVSNGTLQNVGLNLSVGGGPSAAIPNYDTGVIAKAANTTRGNIGGFFVATGGTTNYSLQLQDSTHTVAGRYLRNMTTDGKANWANINITEVTNGLSSTLLGAPNGIATLDNNSKLVMSQMPISVMDYKGTYDIVTNTPNLIDGTGNQGDVYVCTTAGTRTFGPGNTITVGVGDWLIYNGTKWEKTLGNNVGAGTVTSVGLTVGTTGTDVSVSNSPITSAGDITINIPTASATARGLLSSANWSTFNNKVGGSGTLNYLPKWTPNGSTLGNSKVVDNGTNIYIDDANASGYTASKFYVSSSDTNQILKLDMLGSTASSPIGIELNMSLSTNSKSGVVSGCRLTSRGSSTENRGIELLVNNATLGKNIGIFVNTGAGAGGNYSAQLQDGTQTSTGGKYLKDMGDGKANWNYLPDSAQIMMSDMTSAITADAGTPKAFWAAPCNGVLTDMFASLRVPQVGGSVFTVLVKASSTTIGTLTFTNGSAQYMSTNPTSTQTFSKGDLFEFFVSQIGDGSARSLIVTLNFART